MINRKYTVTNDPETGMRLYIHPDARIAFGVVGPCIEDYIDGGLLPHWDGHLNVLMDVVIETSSYENDEFKVYPVCPGQVGFLLDMLKNTRLKEPSIKVSREFFNAAYGIKEK